VGRPRPCTRSPPHARHPAVTLVHRLKVHRLVLQVHVDVLYRHNRANDTASSCQIFPHRVCATARLATVLLLLQRIDSAVASGAQVKPRASSHFPAAAGEVSDKLLRDGACGSPQTLLFVQRARNVDSDLMEPVKKERAQTMQRRQGAGQLRRRRATHRNRRREVKCLLVQNIALKQGRRVRVRRKGAAGGGDHGHAAAAADNGHLSGGDELYLHDDDALHRLKSRFRHVPGAAARGYPL
jgi:hypothetical protein